VQVGSEGNWKLGATGYEGSLALRSNKFYNWGYPSLTTYTSRSSPIQVGSEADWTMLSAEQYGYNGSVAVAGIRGGRLFTWGYNNYGQLGVGDRTTRSSPVQVGADTDWTHVHCMSTTVLGIRGGKLFAWGYNGYGVCGAPSGTVVAYSSPVQIGAETNWTHIAGEAWGAHGLRAGKLYGWGFNGQGELGVGTNDVADHSSPVQVGSFDDWIGVSHGSYYNCAALRKPGRLYTWGYNTWGELGHGNVINRSSPIQVGSGIDWSHVTVGYGFMLGLRSGKLYGWGGNGVGQLGISGTYHSSPVQVGSETDWLFASAGRYQSLTIRHT
jgi:alpha-tubulin suppressor-like RCC1 family protein